MIQRYDIETDCKGWCLGGVPKAEPCDEIGMKYLDGTEWCKGSDVAELEAERDQFRRDAKRLPEYVRGNSELRKREAIQAARIAELEAENEQLKARIARLENDAEMACETPPDSCECAGCWLARETGGEGYARKAGE